MSKKKQKIRPTHFELWKSYEDVAMHFNELLIRLRVQALAALATISSIILVISEFKDVSQSTIFYLMIFLGAAWVSIWILDMRYYNRLLEGAVHALLDIEKVNFEDYNKKILAINLSTSIENSFGNKHKHERTKWFMDSRNWFYLVFLVAILFIAANIGYKVFFSNLCHC
ncbi:MAG: hypothetical protein JXR19_07155 [Bacteroidia bacterium]